MTELSPTRCRELLAIRDATHKELYGSFELLTAHESLNASAHELADQLAAALELLKLAREALCVGYQHIPLDEEIDGAREIVWAVIKKLPEGL